MQEHRLDYGSFRVESCEANVGDADSRCFSVTAICICGAAFRAEGPTFTTAEKQIHLNFAQHLAEARKG